MSQRLPADQLLIGAHTSTAGGIHNALHEGKRIGATTIQLFTSNQRQWKGRVLKEEEIELFKDTQKATGMKAIMSHASYLINLGSPNPEMLQKSRTAFREEVERCLALGLSFLNFHPGASLDTPREECLNRIIESLMELQDLFVDDDTKLLLETTAGQGSCVGCSFEDLAYILTKIGTALPIGVCIDTCHIFVSGYDIRTEESWTKTLETFDKTVGLHYLYAFHVNDSKKEFNSKKDRHASLGEGLIGLDSFKFIMSHPALRAIPKYLETPEGPEVWDKEIWMLREFAR